MKFPFNSKEYQFFTWFRVEEFENENLHWSAMNTGGSRRRSLNYGSGADAAEEYRTTQHVVSMLNEEGMGCDLFIKDKVLHYYANFARNEAPLVVRLDAVPIKRGVWYHVAVTHIKARRLNMFSKDELNIHVDHHLVYQSYTTYPNESSEALQNTKL